MTPEEQAQIAAEIQRYYSASRTTTPGVLKNDWFTAVQATDAWIDSNQASYNAILPASIQAQSLAIKSLLFCAVALGRVSMTLLRRVIGG